ncbi:ABC transporter, ATP-binding protein [Anaerococcus tetradius ATCC 35098]|uniref:ABC transporter, ATP-binding protein n=2 Tax=Anaerococcus tetradius TaxID=33036 RepID=C2CIW6_9FIRM|nr:ABC transporter, ATP-binding protein [Anaerococcus tetradius ATCC 35098]
MIYGIKEVFNISKSYVFLIILSGLLSGGMKILNVYFVKLIVDSIEKIKVKEFVFLILVFVSIIIIVNILNAIISSIVLPKINNKIELGLKKKMYNIYFNIDDIYEPYKYDQYFFSLKNIGVLPEVTSQIGILVNSFFSIVGLLYIFSVYEFSMVFYMFIGVIISFIAIVIKNKINYNITVKNIPNERKIDYINRLFYVPDYSKEVKTTNGDIFFSYLKSAYDNFISEYLKKAKKIAFLDFFSKALTSLTIVMVLFFLGFKVLNGVFTFGTFTMLFTGAQQILSDLNNLFSSFPQIYSLSLKVGKIREFTDVGNHNEVKKSDLTKIKKIELRNVSYTYDNKKNILNNVNLEINKKDGVIALIGGNGSGKSTAINLMLGILKPSCGEVLINGMNIDNFNINTYYDKISIVFQEFYVFSFSVYENISGTSIINTKNENKAIEALKKVGLYEKVKQFERGIHTVISEEFEKQDGGFSKGEMQKLSLARAIYKDGDIFILDEADSFSDEQYKSKLSKIIKELRYKKIIFIVTHNREMLSIADKTYQLNESKISLNNQNI